MQSHKLICRLKDFVIVSYSSNVIQSAFYISRHNFQMELGLLTHIQNRQVELGETF